MSCIAQEILSRELHPFKYFLTCKVSQDDIELFFNNIRACGGFNNNPNACQLRWAMRKLLLCNNVCSGNSNCSNNDVEIPNSILEFRAPKRAIREKDIGETDIFLLSAYSDLLDSDRWCDYQKNILLKILINVLVSNVLKC